MGSRAGPDAPGARLLRVEWLALALGLLLTLRIATSVVPFRRRSSDGDAHGEEHRKEARRMPFLGFGGSRQGSRVIRVIGVGGGGSNAVDRIVRSRTRGIDLIACNTDSQALGRSIAPRRIQIGRGITHGRGAGGDPALGQQAAEADAKRIARALAGSDIVFITAGLGGGTGSGAAPVIARIARDLGALTIAVVTKPFSFEGPVRMQVARAAAASLEGSADTLVTIPNDRVRSIVPAGSTLVEAFRTVDEVLNEGVQAIVDIIARAGLVNLDFADVRAVMHDAGPALVGIGRSSGEDRAVLAARQAVESPLLEAEIAGARRILFNVLGSPGLRLDEVTLAAEEIRRAADPGATVIFGAGLDKRLGDGIVVTVIATGIDLRDEGATDGLAAPATGDGGTGGIDLREGGTPLIERRVSRLPPDLESPSFLRRRRTDPPATPPAPAPAPAGPDATGAIDVPTGPASTSDLATAGDATETRSQVQTSKPQRRK